jgi:hypothetical protein
VLICELVGACLPKVASNYPNINDGFGAKAALHFQFTDYRFVPIAAVRHYKIIGSSRPKAVPQSIVISGDKMVSKTLGRKAVSSKQVYCPPNSGY